MPESRRRRSRDRSVFDDPLMAPPKTDATTGEWDDDGSLRGWSMETADGRIHDMIIEAVESFYGFDCLILRVTEIIQRGRHTRETPRYGESETYYRGYVHAPKVDSLPKGCYGTAIVDCDGKDGWFVWDERAWSNGPTYGESMSEMARRKTRSLAKAAKDRREGRI